MSLTLSDKSLQNKSSMMYYQLNTSYTFENMLDTLISDNGKKVFMNGPSKICGRQPFKHLKWYGQLNRLYLCISQVLLCPFLNTLSHLIQMKD